MCRIFGFRSVLQSGVHASLLSAENALAGQSRRHPDGWGLAYYLQGIPHVVKSTDTAETDELFRKVSGVVSSETVIAHVRKATQGKLSLINTHPFQHGPWTFAHNGNIRNFKLVEKDIETRVPHAFSRWRLGETDSEIMFQFLLARMSQVVDLQDRDPDVLQLMETLAQATQELVSIIGSLTENEIGNPTENYLTYVLTNGKVMIAMQGGLTLHWSTHKKSCPERISCPSLMPLCESPAQDGEQVNHLIVSSEPLQGHNVWNKMRVGDMIAVDASMRLYRHRIDIPTKLPESG